GRPVTDAGQELLDLVEDRVGVTGEQGVIVPGQLDVSRAGDAFGDVLARAAIDRPVATPVQHQRRRMYGRQSGTHIDVDVHHVELLHHRLRRRVPLEPQE